ncbi:MAG: glycosyltransferase [Vicinamibacterales bacterium]
MEDACIVSIVISTSNRCDQLPIAVDACLAQETRIPYEVIVVDNNSTDGTRAWVESRIAAGASRLRYVFEPQQGLPYARNAGIAAARGRYIAFTDDDVYVMADWVEAIARAFARHPDADMIGGKVLPRWPGPLPRWFSRLQWAPLALQEKGDAPVIVDASNAAPCLIGASFAFRRRVFERIGPFDPAFIRSQDREIQLRLWRAGGRGVYVPDMVVWVDVPAERLTKQYFRFWYTRSGRYASRMRLLDLIDHEGRIVESTTGRELLGCPGFIYRQALEHALSGVRALMRRDEARAFYHENRVRFLVSYARERIAARRRDGRKSGGVRTLEARA